MLALVALSHRGYISTPALVCSFKGGFRRALILFHLPVLLCSCSQFLFMVIFTTFLVTCLRFHILWVDTIPFEKNNQTGQRDVIVSDLFDLSGFDRFVMWQLCMWL